MSGLEDITDDFGTADFLDLIPERCRYCKHGLLVVALANQLGEDPLARIIDIDVSCSGYEGPDPTSEYYDEDPDLDRSGCPYTMICLGRNAQK